MSAVPEGVLCCQALRLFNCVLHSPPSTLPVPSKPSATSATQELDRLMASLSDFRVQNHVSQKDFGWGHSVAHQSSLMLLTCGFWLTPLPCLLPHSFQLRGPLSLQQQAPPMRDARLHQDRPARAVWTQCWACCSPTLAAVASPLRPRASVAPATSLSLGK